MSANAADPSHSPALLAEITALVQHEARLVDEGRFDEWLALFTDDGRYWVPSHAGQVSEHGEASIALEDPFLLRLRIDRLRHPQAHSQQPASRALHLLQATAIIGGQAPEWQTRTPFLYFEQRGPGQIQLPGTATHHLTRIDGTLRIRMKRVDLLGAGQALPMIQLFP
ncbi:MAG: aromatic-ring-hydroxylating dioxygenase subunit beta [Burkholderiaceae bacterium]